MTSKSMKIFLLGAIVLTTVAIVIFIHFSNDHMECENYTEHSIGQNGEKISTEKHLCRERLSL
jgi:hypothetical protein